MIEYAAPGHHPPRQDEQSMLRRGASFTWHSFVALALICAVALLGMVATNSYMGAMFAMLGGLAMFAAARWARNTRSRDALSVLSHLETAVRMNLPLVNAMRLWASAEGKSSRRLLHEVTSLLEAGAPVADALRRSGAELPVRMIDRLEAAEHAGRLSTTITQLLDEQRLEFKRDATRGAFLRFYASILLIAVPAIIVMMAIFVIPKYAQILKDFRLPMPMATRLIIAVADGLAPALAVVGILLFLRFGGDAFGEIVSRRSRRFHRRGFVRTLLDHVRWVTPVLHALDRDRGMADVCLTIAEGLEQHRPLPAAVAEASQQHLNAVLAGRVNEWAQNLSDGMAVGAAARSAYLPSLVVGVLGSAREVPDVAAACRFLERYYRSRFSRTYILLHEIGVPLLAFAAGAVVLMIALAIFSPMNAMLDKLATLPVIRMKP